MFLRHLAVLPLLLITVLAAAQTKATVKIKRNVDGKVTEEVRELQLDEGQNINDVLRDMGVLDEFGELKEGQQFSINIEKNNTSDQPQQMELFLGQPGMTPPGFPPNAPFVQIRPGQPSNGAFLGVMMRNESAKAGKTTETGAMVTEVVEGSPAFAAEIIPGDLIVKMNDTDINTTQEVVAFVQSSQIGEKVKITLIRNGKKITKKLELGQRNGENGLRNFELELPADQGWQVFPPEAPNAPAFDFNMGADSILILSPGDSMIIGQPFCWNQNGMCNQQTAYLGVAPAPEQAESGVKVSIFEGTAAAKMGLEENDIIKEVNRQKITSFNELADIIAGMKPGETVKIVVDRNGREKEMEGELGARMITGNQDFRIFHDYKGQDENGDYNYEYEFDMDNQDIEQKMEEMLQQLQMEQERIQSEQDRIQGELDRMREERETVEISIEISEISAEEAGQLNQTANPKVETTNSLVFDKIVFFPNPGDGIINLQFATKEKGNLQVIVYDSNGGKVYMEEQNAFNGSYDGTIDISVQPNGTYFMQIKVGAKTFSKKIIKNS